MDSVSYTALSPLSFLERSARVWPGKTAVIYGTRRLTYSELAVEAQRVARALQASGVRPGDRVAYLMPNLPEMLIAHYAVPLAGAVLVAVNTRLTAEEVAYILGHSGAKTMVVDAAFLSDGSGCREGRGGGDRTGGRRGRRAWTGESGPERRAAAGELLRVPDP